jgi:phospholipid N-methyltransferase
MLDTLKTSISFAKNLFTVGAFQETKPDTVVEVCSKLEKNKKLIVVEFGMGHGNMTKHILDTISKDSTLISFEINVDFCQHVKAHIKDVRLRVINDSALNFKKYVLDNVDNFIISIPFTFLKDKEAIDLVTSCFESLNENGTYSQVVYRENTLMKAVGNRPFEKITVKALINEKIYHIKNN